MGDRRRGGSLEPLVDLEARGRLDERVARLARLFRHARSARPLDDTALARVRARLRAGRDAREESGAPGTVATSPRGPRRLGQWRPTPAMAAGVALLALACAAIAGLGIRSFRQVGPAAARPTPTPEPAAPRAPGQVATGATREDPPSVVPPTDNAAPATKRSAPRARSAAVGRLATTALKKPSPSAAVEAAASMRSPPGPLAEETRLLERALTGLRRDRDGAATLAALDRYRSTFPAGLLRPEAARARVDALFLLGRRSEAGAALEALTLEPRGRDLELLLVRGELRGQKDCSAAIADFDRILNAVTSGVLAERALYGLAVCRARQGDDVAARRAFQDYLRRFPTGRFAAAAERGSRG
jgi:tetratricopeptide (TPR) repeat protein